MVVRVAMLVAGIAGVALAVVADSGPRAAALTNCSVTGYSLDAEEVRLLALINQYREQNGRTALSGHDDLHRTAVWKSTDMGTSATFSHTDSFGRGAYLRAIECGYSVGAGENIAAGKSWDTAVEVFNAWKASTGHNNNMLSTLWRDIGIGRVYVSGSPYGWYWTTEFGAGEPLDPTPTATTTQAATATNTPVPVATATATSTPTISAPTPTPTQAETPTATPTRKAKGRRR